MTKGKAHSLKAFGLVALLLIAGCASGLPAYEGPTEAPLLNSGDLMTAGDIQAVVVGNTMVGVGKAARWYRHFSASGKLSSYNFPFSKPENARQWDYVQGRWSVEDQGLCLLWAGATKPRCFTLRRDGKRIYGYDAATGEWAFNAEIKPGNALKS